MKVFVREIKKNIKTCFISDEDKVFVLKEKIKQIFSITGEIRLIFNGIVPEDDELLCDLGIFEGSIIDFIHLNFQAG